MATLTRPPAAIAPRGGSRSGRCRIALRLLAIRLAIAVPVTVAVSAAMFAVASLSPFDPLVAYLGDNFQRATPAQREAMRAAYDLDQPWWQAWWTWVNGLLHGDLGWSSTQSLPVSAVLAERMPFTVALSGCALLLASAIAILVGVMAGMRRDGVLDRLANAFAVTFAAVPPFVVSLALVAVFAVGLRWFPASGAAAPGDPYTAAGVLRHAVLPLIALALSQIPWLLLTTRTAVVEACASDAVRSARARGVHGWALMWGYIAPVSVLPTLALLGTRLPELIAGAAIVETVFGWPGMAAVLVESAAALDFPLLAALTVGSAVAVLAGSALSDAAAVAVDPRIGMTA
ncbi:ABC transporter permease [Mycolicibacterium phlei]|uniref:ABC transporter permease n=1 Tax=Mycolicibacterium phlei TaxID=1771 RepID=UPI00025AD20B|nr:ABC transporter permease [Mycolicibacterium phlei]EID16039.1 dipeptide/oligopeptide/nickel ABC transporter permease [Mycolicibacterium phlei RIVM601174]MBF4195179.1 dipeptide/oligopeptide/nickel ABC transporter permease [Mycolicibacterium phlei]